MTIFQNNLSPLPPIPDNLTIPQFILRELELPGRPVRPRNVPYFIDNGSGRAYNYEEVGPYAALFDEALKLVSQGAPPNLWPC